ncbi:glycosyltransferase [Pseudothermotoga sp.]
MLQIHQALKQRGHQSYLAYGREPAKNCEEAIRIGSNFDVYHHVLLTRLFDLHGFGSKRATARFVQMIGKIDPDIIHLHNVHGYYLNIGVLFKFLKEFGKPVVWTLHDCWPFTGHCAYFVYAKCERWRTGCHSCPEKSSYPKSLLLDNSRWNYRKKKELFTGLKHLTIVTPSRWLAGLVKESFLSEYPVEVIPNGIDTNVFKPTPSDFRKKYGIEDKFIILGVANVWDRRKGFEYFLELSKFLSQREVIVLVGVNDRQMKTLPKNIIGIKRTNSPEELAQIYTAADVFLNPTLEDNYPTVNLEAQACGTFVVTFDSGGAAETVISEESGIVLRKKSVEEIHTVLRRFGKKEDVFEKVSEKLYEISTEAFTQRYLVLYQSLKNQENSM